MRNEIVAYLSKYTSISDELIDVITKTTIINSFKKGTLLLKEGDIPNESYFILKGCIRSYIVKEGEEKTIDFYTEEQAASPLNFGKNSPSEHYLECIEDTTVSINTPGHEQEMFRKYPQFESVCRIMSEVMLVNYRESLANYKTTTPEDRYLSLLKNRPDLVRRVPLYQLSSYIGVKPESLSRIRKRISKK
ncbi:MAG: Crp/Fnr family transcriptional regulator [Rudanella sp.]|nr:Crp/Fnr family transcriptional regulator [Rudanella sp.]